MKQQDLLSATFLVIRFTQHFAYHENNKRTAFIGSYIDT